LWRPKELGNHEHKARQLIGNRFKTRQTGDTISTHFVNLTTLIVAVSRDTRFNLRKNQYLEVLKNGVNCSRACVWPREASQGSHIGLLGRGQFVRATTLTNQVRGREKKDLADDVRVYIHQVHRWQGGYRPLLRMVSLFIHAPACSTKKLTKTINTVEPASDICTLAVAHRYSTPPPKTLQHANMK
jgi:hypothetical protein